MTAQNDTDYTEKLAKTTNDELNAEFDKILEMYTSLVNKNYAFNGDWDYEIFDVQSIRADLHDITQEFEKRGMNYKIDSIRTLDKKWQAWALSFAHLNHTSGVYVLDENRDPKEQWWLWVDQLNDLTEEQKATI